MKKLLLILCLSCVLDVDAELTLKIYEPCAKYFTADMDLIDGWRLLHENIVDGQRFYGSVVKVNKDGEDRFGAIDTSSDPATRVNIKMFPSPYSAEGATFALTPYAKNSLTSCFGGEAYDTQRQTKDKTVAVPAAETLVKLIAGMFHVANRTRAGSSDWEPELTRYDKAKTPEAGKALVRKTFFLTESENEAIFSADPRRYGFCASLIRDIVASVRQEKITYPLNYTNWLISAYAWKVLEQTGDVERLVEALRKNGELVAEPETIERALKEPTMFDRINTIVTYENADNPFPLLLNEKPVTNGVAFIDHLGDGGSDCTETTIRELITLLLSTREKIIDTQKLPMPNSSVPNTADSTKPLRTFFEQMQDAEALFTSGLPAIRYRWFDVVESLGAPIQYRHKNDGTYKKFTNGTQVATGWKNILTVICTLLRDCKAGIEFKEAVDTVSSWKEDTNVSADDIVSVLNKLLTLRSDVQLKAEALVEKSEDGYKPLQLAETQHEVYGAILISYGTGKDKIGIVVSSDKGHSEFGRLKNLGTQASTSAIKKIVGDDELFNTGQINLNSITLHPEKFLISTYKLHKQTLEKILEQLIDGNYLLQLNGKFLNALAESLKSKYDLREILLSHINEKINSTVQQQLEPLLALINEFIRIQTKNTPDSFITECRQAVVDVEAWFKPNKEIKDVEQPLAKLERLLKCTNSILQASGNAWINPDAKMCARAAAAIKSLWPTEITGYTDGIAAVQRHLIVLPLLALEHIIDTMPDDNKTDGLAESEATPASASSSSRCSSSSSSSSGSNVIDPIPLDCSSYNVTLDTE